MNWRNMTIGEASKYPGFYWFMLVEAVLLLCAIGMVFTGRFVEAFLLFILLELREICFILQAGIQIRED